MLNSVKNGTKTDKIICNLTNTLPLVSDTGLRGRGEMKTHVNGF